MHSKENEIAIDHRIKVSRVFQYIEEHLDQDLSLNKIAEIAYLSPYHFHRIFKYVTGENLNEYVIRQRIEKAATQLLHSSSSIAEIAYKYGYNDQAAFTKSFKKYYQVSPSAFKKENPNKYSKIRQIQSKNGQEYPSIEDYLCTINNLLNWIKMNTKFEVKEIAKLDLAYISCVGPQNLESTYQKLMRWAMPQGLMNDDTKMITIFHDSFKVNEAPKVRMSASILLHKEVEPDGEVALKTIEAGKYIVGHYEIQMHEFEKAWTGAYLWMNENGFSKDDRHPFELYHNNFNDHPERKAIVDIYIPVK
jgi:AraC family transcriptional regulator